MYRMVVTFFGDLIGIVRIKKNMLIIETYLWIVDV